MASGRSGRCFILCIGRSWLFLTRVSEDFGIDWKRGCSSSNRSSCSSNTHITWALARSLNTSLSRLHHANIISFSRRARHEGLGNLNPLLLACHRFSPSPYCSGLQGTGPIVGPCVGLVVWFPLFPIGFRVGRRYRQDLVVPRDHEHV